VIERLLRTLDSFFERRSRNAILLMTLVAAIAIGVLDHYSEPDLLLLYLIPIFIAGWYGGWAVGSVVAIYCSASAFVTGAMAGKSGYGGPGTIEMVNLLVHLIAYLTIAKVVSRLKESRRQTGYIVHALRAPNANAISGLMTIQQSGANLGPDEKEMVDLALVSSQRAVTLVNSLLDISKLESGKFDITEETVDLNGFLDDCFNQVELWANANHITLTKNLLATEATFDPRLTARVIVNLLSNALKFSPENTAVNVRAQIIHHTLRVGIEDQGPGIPHDLIKEVFQPFNQVKGTQSGTGLGLAFCRLAVHAQHGHIWVDPDVEKGTTVWFSIPQPEGPKHNHSPLPQPTEV
jgi:signal transduction histidine kinase